MTCLNFKELCNSEELTDNNGDMILVNKLDFANLEITIIYYIEQEYEVLVGEERK